MCRFPAVLLSMWMCAAGAHALDQKDVVYATPAGKPQMLNLHVPEGPGPFTAVVIVHGGGFDAGDRNSLSVKPLEDVLTGAGVAWFSIDYRRAPDDRFPQAIEDVNTAIRWVKAHAKDYHVDPNRVVISGESAGGFLVGYAATHPEAGTKVAAVLDFYGPSNYEELAMLRRDHPERFDIKNINGHVADGGGIRFFGVDTLDTSGLARLHEISPFYAVKKGVPPFLMLHGNKDDQVAYEQSPKMCDAVRKVGGACDLITVDGGGHGMRPWDRSEAMQHWKPELLTWLKRTVGI